MCTKHTCLLFLLSLLIVVIKALYVSMFRILHIHTKQYVLHNVMNIIHSISSIEDVLVGRQCMKHLSDIAILVMPSTMSSVTKLFKTNGLKKSLVMYIVFCLPIRIFAVYNFHLPRHMYHAYTIVMKSNEMS